MTTKAIYKTLALSIGLSLASLSPAMGQNTSKRNKQSYAKALEIMASSMALLDKHFVDSVDMDRISRYGIDAMLQSLDPYTEYFSKEDNEKLQMLTTGEYAGIGAIISQRADSTVLISDPMEGMPAAEAGLKAGDIILEVDGKDFRRSTSEAVSTALKGTPGSKIVVLIQRMGEKKPRKIEFVRRKIVVNPVPYYGLSPKGYGYIAVNSFTTSTSREVRKALDELRQRQPLSGLILDLRGNTGGLFEEAIKLVSLFVPEGSVVVSTKGRSEARQDATYRTQARPIDTELPLVVLINGESASSSEIVAGALQDMDRAVIVGRKSFGKGLVQSTVQLPYEGILKLTTAKYYIPSGRCIQRINYDESRRGGEVKATPDSLAHVFYTAAGRPVRDAGGILPDVEVKADSLPTMLYYLNFNNDLFDWVTAYTIRHPSIASPTAFTLTEADYQDFSRMMIEKKFDYDRQSARQLDKLKEIAQIEGYLGRADGRIDSLITSLSEALKPNLAHDLETLRPQIEDLLVSNILSRYYYRRGTTERGLLSDKVVQEAEAILSSAERYKAILSPAAPRPQETAK